MIVLDSSGSVELCFNNITPFFCNFGPFRGPKMTQNGPNLAGNGPLTCFLVLAVQNGWFAVGSSHGTSHPMYLNHFWNIGYAQFWARVPKIGPHLAENGSNRFFLGILVHKSWTNVDLGWNQLWDKIPNILELFLEIWVCPILSQGAQNWPKFSKKWLQEGFYGYFGPYRLD